MSYNNTQQYFLGDLYDISSGLSKSKDQFGSGYPFLSFKTVFNHTIIPTDLKDLAQTTLSEQNKYSILYGDVFLTRTSETANELGMSSVALKNYPQATFNGFTKRLRPKKGVMEIIDPKFIAYYLRTKDFRNQIDSISVLTTRASLNQGMIEKLTITVPNIKTQKKIAAILSALDEKIAINRAINENLALQMQTIWENLFCSGMESGNRVSLGDYLYIKGRIGWKGLKKEEYLSESPYRIINGESLTANGIDWSKAGFIPANRYNESPEIMLQIGDILISKDGTIGKVGYVDKLDKPTSVASGIFIVRNLKPQVVSTIFIYCLLTSSYFKEFIASRTEGSVIPHLYQKDFVTLEVPLLSEKQLRYFNDTVTPLFDMYFANQRENLRLSEVRDVLLPKLMSGEINVI